MDIQKEREAFERLPDINAILHNSEFGFNEGINQYYHPNHAEHRLSYAFLMGAWSAWQAAKAQAVPEGFVLVKKANRIGNPNVDFSQAPRWAKYWLKDGHSNKYWWSSTRPIKDMDLQAFCWRGDYFAEEAPSFNFAGSWDKSLTSKEAMIEAQEQK